MTIIFAAFFAQAAWACQSDRILTGVTERGYGQNGEFVQGTALFSVLYGSQVVDFGNQEILQLRAFRGGCKHEYYAIAADCSTGRGFHVHGPVGGVNGRSWRPLVVHDWPSNSHVFLGLPSSLKRAGVISLETLFVKAKANGGEIRALSELGANERQRENIAPDDLSTLCSIHYPDSAGARL